MATLFKQVKFCLWTIFFVMDRHPGHSHAVMCATWSTGDQEYRRAITYPYGPYFGAIHGVILSICIAVGKHLSERVAYTGEENKKGCYYFHWLNRYGIELTDLVKYN